MPCGSVEGPLSFGKWAMVMVEFTAFFDESGTHDSAPILCMGGLVLENEAAKQLSVRWKEMLDGYGLPFFRMAACAHGAKPFDRLDKDQRIAVETEAISIIRSAIKFGFAVSVYPSQFDKTVPHSPEIGSPYSLCAHTCLTAVRGWANRFNIEGKISYVFEAGHRSQAEANGIMIRLFKKPNLRAEHRYAGHSFADKSVVLPLQAADIIAWQWFTENKRQLEGIRPNPRGDFVELMRKPIESGAEYHAVHLSEKLLSDLSRPVLMNEYPLTYPWRN
jgi:hypothetical protein